MGQTLSQQDENISPSQRGPLLHRQHQLQQGNLSSAAQRVAQPTVNDKLYLQSALPYSNSNQFSRGGLENDQPDMPPGPAVNREQMPLFYWFGMAAWNKTRGTARVDLMRPRWSGSTPSTCTIAVQYTPSNTCTIGPLHEHTLFLSEHAKHGLKRLTAADFQI